MKISREQKSKANRAAHEFAIQFEQMLAEELREALGAKSSNQTDDQVISMIVAGYQNGNRNAA